jgi:predicted CXXCH cytochrome family protein
VHSRESAETLIKKKTKKTLKGRDKMKRILMAGAAVLMTASVAFAVSGVGKDSHSIVDSRHNLPGKAVAFAATNATYQQICIYCHTPHNPRLNVPLWNRNATNNTYTYYNSPSLTTYTKANQKVTTSSVSGFCLSCHDGVTSTGNIKNAADTGIKDVAGKTALDPNELVAESAGASNPGNATGSHGNIGTDLSNDHPVGFNYDNAYNSLDVDQGGTDTAQGSSYVRRLWDITMVKKTLGNFLFSKNSISTENGTEMECASCHKVHDPFNPPFLRVTNNMSHLCLACHNK